MLLATPAGAQHDSGQVAAQPPGLPGEALFPTLEALRREAEAAGWLIHGQATFVEQGHPAFHAPYRGANSMQSKAMQRNTFSADLILGRRLWEGAEVVVNPQVFRGFGLSGTTGVAAFPNGEAFRIGSVPPAAFIPRVFFRQTIALGGPMLGNAHHNPDHPDLLRFAEPVPAHRITITAGKFSVFDIFDDNRYAHEARLHFLNWAFVGGAAFDFANDAKGYTNGLALEWDAGHWGLRAGALQVARRLNSLSLDPQPGRGHQFLLQLDRFWFINGHQGAVRLLGGYSRTRSSSWNELLATDIEATLINPNGRYAVKRMAVLNFEQELAKGFGVFARLSWNDGKTQNWMYTEMDRAASIGLDSQGSYWGRPEDSFGLAVNIGGISPAHRRFLEAGGIGFITGDGRLRYRPEVAVETYYATDVGHGVELTGDVQLVVNPAYNADRGPIAFFALRLRSAF